MSAPAYGYAQRRQRMRGTDPRYAFRRLPWHRVESIIDGDVITKCGRRMAEHVKSYGTDLLRYEVLPAGYDACQQCGGEWPR